MSNITIVLAADTGYAEQVHTLMKSVCTHNTNVDFYLMHNTFRREWIDYTNQKLAASGSRLNDVKIEMDFSQYRRLSHISDTAFFRLMMQHLPVDRARISTAVWWLPNPCMICSTSICAVIPLRRYKIPFWRAPSGNTLSTCTPRPISIQACCWPI